tara:strand:+ start:915 stop:2702 length:1788 start_codon:yes stop_codon:yes gene_type:complete
MAVSKKDIDAYRKLLLPENFGLYAEAFLKIQSKTEGLVPLRFNPSQVRLNNAVASLIRQGKPIRIIALKARQQGFSTWTEAFMYKQTTTTPDYRSCIIAHEDGASTNLYKMFKTYHKHFPEALRPFQRTAGSAKGLEFGKLRSSIRVLTAKNALASSSGTYQAVHISELSKWQFAEEAMLSLMQTVPREGTVIIESTAYGVGNHFCKMWYDAKRGKNDFLPLFFPWWEHPEYEIPLEDGEEIVATQEEGYYEKRFKLSKEQIKWMKYSLQNDCGGDWDNFRQEYPASEDEAFISSGRPVFDMKMLQKREMEIEERGGDEMVRGNFILREEEDKSGKNACAVTFEPDLHGDVEIYDMPKGKGEDKWAYRYVLGIDTSEGLQKSSGGDKKKAGDTDFNVGSLWDKINNKQVLYFRNKMDGDEVARLILCIIVFYGGSIPKSFYPLVAVERNKDGLTVLMYARDLFKKYGIPLARFYHRGVMDTDAEPSTEMLGWRTTGDSKPPLIGEMQKRIREGTDGIKSLQVIRESKVFVRDDKGRMNAQSGQWDDSVIANALTYEGARRDHLPYVIKRAVAITGWRKKHLTPADNSTGYWSGQK